MKKEVEYEIHIIPAKFAENSGDNHCIVNCLLGKNNDGQSVTKRRLFDKMLLEGIENPTYLFIGIMTGKGFIDIKVIDGKDYEDLFIEKWGCLDLTAM